MADEDDNRAAPLDADRDDRQEPSRPRSIADELEEQREALWFEIERDIDKALAEPAEPDRVSADRNIDAGDEQARQDSEEERRRRLELGGELPEGTASTKEVDARDPEPDKDQEARKIDRTFPDEIARGYYVRADHLGHQHVYADSKGSREIFQDSETKLRTKLNDPQCVKLMLDTAAHRGWASISVNGSKEFKREAWLEGQARGIAVTGYRPTELDLQELKIREQAHLRNEIVPDDVQDRADDNVQDRPAPDPHRLAGGEDPQRRGTRDRGGDPSAELVSPTEQPRADRRSLDYKRGIEGVLVEQGTRPYKDNPKAEPSPFAVLQDDRGREHTVWGVGLPDALLKSRAQPGDQVRLQEAGMERVTKSVIREVNGRQVLVRQEVDRRAWEAEVTRERETAQRDHASGREERQGSQGHVDREHRINAAEQKVARAVAGAERSLHVGPARDAALSDGMLANEVRAKQYMAGGRAVAMRDPELKNAAMVEVYIERKLRNKFPGDPTAVQRGMAVARNRISSAIARGHDFPQPRVVESRELDRTAGRQDAQERGEPQSRNTPRGEAVQMREQDRGRNQDREREADRVR